MAMPGRARCARTAIIATLAALLPLVAVALDATPSGADTFAHRGLVAERPRDETVNFADGSVFAIAQAGNRVVVGGSFTKAGPAIRGAAGPVDTTAGAFASGFPDVAGAVYVTIPDGAGGWFLGGQFTSVGGIARTNLAHVDATKSVTAFVANTNGAVRDLELVGADLYLGGDFTTVNDASALRVAKVDAVSGARTWGANVNNVVRTIEPSVDGTRLYIGGDYTRIDGIDQRRLGALDTATGARVASFLPGTVNNILRTIELANGSLWIGGDFTTVNGVSRTRLAQIDPTTGSLGSFDVSANGNVYDLDLNAAGTTMYLVGRFFTVGGQARRYVANVNVGAGTIGSLSAANLGSGGVNTLALDEAGNGLYLGGDFVFTPEKTEPAKLARIDLGTNTVTRVVSALENPASLARNPIGGTAIWSLARDGAALMVGGDFSDYGFVDRARLAAYDLDTGALDLGFDPAPSADVNVVRASADGTAVFVGGAFQTIGGQARQGLAKLDITTGAVDPGFVADTNSYVKDLAVRSDGTALYVGGNFLSLNGQRAERLGVVDPVSGSLLPGHELDLTEPTNDNSEGGARAVTLSPDETRLMVVGNFRKIAGVERPLVAQVDVSGPTPTVTDWVTNIYDVPCARNRIGWMRDVDVAPDGLTAYVVSAGHFYYPACDSINAFSMTGTGTPLEPLWTKKVGDTLESVAATEDAVYISGHFRYLETETQSDGRFQVGALDPATGVGINWNPNADGLRGVLVLESEPAGLFMGSDGDTVGGVPHGRFAHWDAPTPGLVVRKTPDPSVSAAAGGTVTYHIAIENTFDDRSIDLSALSDTRLGNLAAACSLPQTIAPLATNTCDAAEVLSGDNLDTVSGTVTATGTANGSPVSDTDTSTVKLLSSPPQLRLRNINGPTAVPFPSGQTQLSLTMMNLDMRRPMTMTALSADRYGDLNGVGTCAVPQVVAPNGLYHCTYWGEISGPVGSRVTVRHTATADYGGSISTSTASSTTTMAAPAQGTDVLYVVANPAALTAAEIKARDRLDNSYNVILADDNTVTSADADGKVLVFISSSVANSRITTKFRDVATPVMLAKAALFDDNGMTANGANQGTYSSATVTVTDTTHPLATARTGTQTILGRAQAMNWAITGAQAEEVADLPNGRSGLFAYHEGALLANGNPAAGCRIGVPFANGALNRLNTTGWSFFDFAVAYGTSECGTGIIHTVAGNGSQTYLGNGLPATGNAVRRPQGVTVDPTGQYLVITDTDNNAVRRVNIASGVMTTLAGTGTAGSGGNGGPATSAQLNAPMRSYYGPDGNLYIADTSNHRIRVVDAATGIIATFAGTGTAGFSGDGGAATAARLNSPSDLAWDSTGNLYVADRSNNRVRRITPGGTITTFAGNGSSGFTGDDVDATTSRLNTPYGVDVGPDDVVYIADYNNERIRAVDGAGIIHTVAGTGIAGTGGDGGIATEADLHKPIHVMIDPNGGLWISEVNNTKVRYVDPNGTIVTIAGTTTLGFSGDGGQPIFAVMNRPSATTMDAAGNVYVADRDNRRIRLIHHS